jgi:predicted Rossmann fold nucleotide-binding protein DprA/Smf involved in DNA uptake
VKEGRTVVKEPNDILIQYEAKTATARAQGSQIKEFCDPSTADMLYLRALLHPTSKRESRDMTRRLIELLCEKKICTAEELYAEMGRSTKSILRRLKILRQNGYLRRESKKYYITTHRMHVMHRNFLDRVCG